MKQPDIVFDKSQLAYCGLYCQQCSHKLAYEENDPAYFDAIPYAFRPRPLSECNCEGCKGYCICGHCAIKPCAEAKNLDSCAGCMDFPCDELHKFENDGLPHHKDAIENLRQIRQFGADEWFARAKHKMVCGVCGKRQSWYRVCPEHGGKTD